MCLRLNIYQSVADNFLHYVSSLDLDKINELNGVNGPGMLNTNQQTSARSLLETGCRFPLTNGQLYVPNGEKLEEITGDKLNLKELYKKFKELSCTLWYTYLFFCGFKLFLGGKEKTSKEVISELYSNLSLKALSENDES